MSVSRHPPTIHPQRGPPTQTHHFTIPVRRQAQHGGGREELEKSNFLVPSCSHLPRHLSFQALGRLFYSYVSLLCPSLSGVFSLSFIAVRRAPALSSTPARQRQHSRQRESQQVTLAVCPPEATHATTTTKPLTNTRQLPSEAVHTHTHTPTAVCSRGGGAGFVNELLPWHWNPCFPKPLWTEERGCEILGIHTR